MNELIQFKKCRFEKNGLIIEKGLAYKEWENLGKALNQVEGSVQFWIGDWIRYGENEYGKMYTQALKVTELDYGTLRNYKFTAENIELSRRHDNLKYTCSY